MQYNAIREEFKNYLNVWKKTPIEIDGDIIIVTAIFKQVKSADKLFKDISNRYVIEKL